MFGIGLSQVQHLVLVLVELHEVHVGPLLKSVKAPLDGITSFYCVSCITQLAIIHTLAVVVPVLSVINKDIKQ